jgi:hypothetical protein
VQKQTRLQEELRKALGARDAELKTLRQSLLRGGQWLTDMAGRGPGDWSRGMDQISPPEGLAAGE